MFLYAYFTDTDAKANVFTAGNVDITLKYEATDNRFYPGKTHTTYANITNGNSEEAYIGAVIDITIPSNTSSLTINNILDVFTGLNANTVKYVKNGNVYTVYVIVENEVAVNTKVDIFTDVTIPEAWNNADMSVFNGLDVKITAFATQTVGFNNATEALTKAFKNTVWDNYPVA